jgi:hypothetical protein
VVGRNQAAHERRQRRARDRHRGRRPRAPRARAPRIMPRRGPAGGPGGRERRSALAPPAASPVGDLADRVWSIEPSASRCRTTRCLRARCPSLSGEFAARQSQRERVGGVSDPPRAARTSSRARPRRVAHTPVSVSRSNVCVVTVWVSPQWSLRVPSTWSKS